MASGYEKAACGVDPGRGWDVRRRPRPVQRLINRTIWVLTIGLFTFALFSFVSGTFV